MPYAALLTGLVNGRGERRHDVTSMTKGSAWPLVWLRHRSLLVCNLAYRCECGECLWRLEYWRGEQVETIWSDSVTVRPEKDCSAYEFVPRSGTSSCVWRGMG